MLQRDKGNLGEDRAAEYLTAKGYEVLSRNYRRSYGEWDLICRDGETLVFIEVKNWDSFEIDSMAYSLTPKRVKRMKKLAQDYLDLNPRFEGLYCRFDLVFLSGRTGSLEHITEAF